MAADRPRISIVIPCYRDAEAMPALFDRLEPVMDELADAELVLVDDGSPDGTAERAADCAARWRHPTRVIRLLRNFGQHAAVFAGFAQSRGEVVVTMDSDLQYPPEDIGRLIRELSDVWPVVSGRRIGRRDPRLRRIASRWLTWWLGRRTGVRLDDYGSMFRAYDRKVVERLLTFTEQRRSIPALVGWLGVPVKEIPVAHRPRDARGSRYRLRPLVEMFIDVVTGYSTFPLRVAAWTGVAGALTAFLIGVVAFAVETVGGGSLRGVTAAFAAVFLLLALQLVAVAVIGEYAGRIYREAQNRPFYLVDSVVTNEAGGQDPDPGSRAVRIGEPSMDAAEERAVVETLRSGWLGQGPAVERFEERFARYLGASHVVAVSSCSAALALALRAIGIGPGDEVVTTPFTFVATVNAIEQCGARAVLADIDPDSLNLTPASARQAITERTRAVVPVHFAGRPLDVRGFYELADERDLWIVEDAAHAAGAVADGRRVGGSGHARSLACFSFYPNKNLASADGGAISLQDDDLARRLVRMRNHGLDEDAWGRDVVGPYRPAVAVDAGQKATWTDLQAAIALAQLDKLDDFIAARERLAARYDELIGAIDEVEPVRRGRQGEAWRHALHLYQVVVEGGAERRDAVIARMRSRGIGAGVHYVGINRHPYYRARFAGLLLPVSDWASESVVTLPLHPRLSGGELERVCDALQGGLAETAAESGAARGA